MGKRVRKRARAAFPCLLLVLAASVSPAYAEPSDEAATAPTTDLVVLLKAAERRNPGLRAAQHNIAAAQAHLGEAWVSPFFRFDAIGSFAIAPEARGTPIVSPDSEFPLENRWLPAVRAEIRGTLPLWTFGKLSAARDAARAGVRGAELEKERTRARLGFDLRRAYYGLQLALDTQQMISEGKGKLEKAVKRLEERIAEGDPEANPTDRYRLSSTLAEVEARSSEAEGLEAGARAALEILTGLKRVRVPDCPLATVDFKAGDLVSYGRMARFNRPETGILGAAIAASRADVNATRAKYLPDIGLALQAGISHAPGVTDQNNPFTSDPANYKSFGAALVARWSMDFWGNSYRDSRVSENLLRARAGLDQALEGIELEVSRAHAELQNALRREAAWREGHRDARRWFVAAAQADQMGVGEAKELVDAVRAYFTARYSHLQSIHDFNMAIASLEKAVGAALLKPEKWRQTCGGEAAEQPGSSGEKE